MSKKFTASGACSMHPTGTTPPMDFKLAQYACDLRVWNQWCLPFDPFGACEFLSAQTICTCTTRAQCTPEH